ncbi:MULTISPECIES: hypothetical protein [unclassified Bradyrhizobium]|uniref:hypothetical protein n=1 Tax=unclassified Bradyrhizobium TaxID=2631580 RepID=UPI00041C52AE|nr:MULTISPECIES: hypothetical protein [unclassified Bradyrhizobium]QIG95974.1 hypothetical protein G6P99_28655 [Bradyrhizobium sp. 6(2017)]
MKAIEQIVAGFVSLKDRQALEKLKHHRRQLLDDVQTHGVGPSVVSDILRGEVEIIEAALARFDENRALS